VVDVVDCGPGFGDDGPMSATEWSAGSRALLVSMWASVAFAVVSLAWGLVLGSQLIVFDGLYSFASVGLSLLAVLALRAAGKGADERYPWGRDVWEPLAIVVKAAALGALCLSAVASATGELLRGGREIAAGWALAYAVVATVAGAAVSWYLRRAAARDGSDLVRAEAAEWSGDTLLSLGVLGGFLLAVVLADVGRADLARYVDPAMVAVISLAFLRVPARLLTSAMREVLTMAPPEEITRELRGQVEQVRRRYGLAESFLRCSKVGGRLDVEVDFVVDVASRVQTVTQFDEVRADLQDRLRPFGRVSMSVGFTGDRKWAL
jgi:cation diffusion facilitator family transporter